LHNNYSTDEGLAKIMLARKYASQLFRVIKPAKRRRQ